VDGSQICARELQEDEGRNVYVDGGPRPSVRDLVTDRGCLRVLEVHSPIAALVAERAAFVIGASDPPRRFDAFWSGSLADSTVNALPDIEIYSVRERLANVSRILQVASRPVILDADTGGDIEHLQITVPIVESTGVSALVMEDKVGAKRNSLVADHSVHRIAAPAQFAAKIAAAKSAQRGTAFMVFARVESLILGLGVEDALRRAFCYVDAGADGIMIHSKDCSPAEVVMFAGRFRQVFPALPLMAVPTTYSEITAAELFESGFTIVVYANHLLRASMKAMADVADSLLAHDRAMECEARCESIGKLVE